MQSITPYVKAQHFTLKLIGAITEHEATRHPRKARKAIAKLLAKRRSQAVCTHRPVLPLVFAELTEHMSEALAAFLPATDPYLRPGALLVAQQPVSGKGKLVSVEVYDAFED